VNDCASISAADVINSATPVETGLLGVHPRMLASRQTFDVLRGRLATEPWAGWLAELRKEGDRLAELPLPEKLMGLPYSVFDVRQLGEQLIHLALLYRLGSEPRYRDRIELLMQRLGGEPDWGHSLIYGHWARGFAFALDWLWDDFDGETRGRHVETLYARSRNVFEAWASYRSGEPFGYTWNISAVVLGGLAATAACLYGERPDVAPMANLAWEKMRGQSAALGPDGVSPEGLMYGGYYAAYLTISFLLAEDLFGFDLYGTTPWLSRHARAVHAQSLPRESWKSDDLFFHQGDAHGPVFGYETILRTLASRLKDGEAQWFADEILRCGAIGAGPFSFLLYDPEVKPMAPTGRPPFDFMSDFGIAVMRENWSGAESACSLKCGPNVGHHAAKRFSHPLGGGHMQPNNGDVQIFSHGGWILVHPGYVYKDTSYHNTLLIDGLGQLGEKSEWMEDLSFRQSRRYPFMVRADHHEGWDYGVADMTAAYPESCGLVSLRRHVMYVRPDSWILVDAVLGAKPVTPSVLFHTAFPVQPDGAGAFCGRGEKAACRIRFHATSEPVFAREEQPRLHTSGHQEGTLHLLKASPRAAALRHLIVTEIQAFPADSPAPEGCRIVVSAAGDSVRVSSASAGLDETIGLFPKRE
jgi:hypothetical protein